MQLTPFAKNRAINAILKSGKTMTNAVSDLISTKNGRSDPAVFFIYCFS